MTAASDEDGLQIKVDGKNFTSETATVSLMQDSGTESKLFNAVAALVNKPITSEEVTVKDGTFSTTLKAAAADLDKNAGYMVVVDDLSAKTVELTDAQKEALFPKPEFEGSVTLPPSESGDEFKIKAEGKDFDQDTFPAPFNTSGSPADGTYLAAFKPGTDLSKVTMENMDDYTLGQAIWVTGASLKKDNNTFSKTIVGIPGDYAGQDVQVVTWVAHGNIREDVILTNDTIKMPGETPAPGEKKVTAGTVQISGSAKVGQTLTAKTSGWKNASSYSYQWLRDGKSISTATKPTYKATKADEGKKLSVKVTGKKSGYTSASKTSGAVTIAKASAPMKQCAPATFTKDGRTITTAPAADGTGYKIGISGKGFINGKLPQRANDSGNPAAGVYVAAFTKDADLSKVTMENMDDTVLGNAAWVTPGKMDAKGNFTTTLAEIPASAKGQDVRVVTRVAHGNIRNDVILTDQLVSIDCVGQSGEDGNGDGQIPVGNGAGNGNNADNGNGGKNDAAKQCEPVVSTKDGRTVTAAAFKDGSGYKVTLSGKGFVNDKLPKPVNDSGKPADGVYAAAVKPDADLSKITLENMDSTTLGEPIWITKTALGSGSFNNSLRGIPADAGDEIRVITWVAHGNIREDVITSDQVVKLDCATARGPAGANGTGTTAGSATSGSVTSGQAAAAKQCRVVYVSDGSAKASAATSAQSAPQAAAPAAGPAASGTATLNWGVKASFLSYIKGGIAKGAISTSGGAQQTGSSLTWGTGSGSLANGGTVSFPGSVHFTGHNGVLDTKFSNVRIKSEGAGKATLILDSKSQDMEGKGASQNGVSMATITFSGDGSNGITNGKVTLTAAGAKAFAGFYSAGQELDNLNLTVSGASASAAGGATNPVALFAALQKLVNADTAKKDDAKVTTTTSTTPVESGITVPASANASAYQAGAPKGMKATIVCGDKMASTVADNANLIGAGVILALLGAAGVAFAARRKTTAKN
ncbi:MAG: HtaA domain-containing protein [Galactobacter sp.]